ncbi:MAG: 5-(carboxyamino)imidazole ribonucleotide mutase [Alphaproteobacteria bacterium]|jgi:phosphoribosylaminoimidazole carboxylase PurE protein|nr:5-(carboxyamino)imidazole ribonucleotide mutase [Alphaproteobacteria bacterium]
MHQTSGSAIDVMILMGSDSDWEAMSRCHDVLHELDVPHEVHVASAHRTPDKVMKLVADAPGRGVKVFICAAGMAAHLGGVVAAHARCPTIGVPMTGGMMDGLDALLSTVQMPPGVPVAAVGTGSAGARNAAVLAGQIIALTDPDLAERLGRWRAAQAEAVEQADQRLQSKMTG